MRSLLVACILLAPSLAAQSSEAELDAYIERSVALREQNAPSAGSLFTETGFLAEVARDPRAGRVGDLVTVMVSEQASALTSGSTTQSRDSGSDSSISRLLGVMGAGRPLPNLFGQTTKTSLTGQASTARNTNVTAVVTAHVTQVMPNGNLIIEGAKEVSVNSERQMVWIRGVVRQADLAQDNSVSSERLGLLDLRVNGKGVVNAAIRRPNIVYRVFRDLLPF
ncbi:MAG: hypothetical protein GC160_28730 [Acidobacteria bacterium]|nr:hypothetical protein [Acidobacteriota bacterium]